MDTSEDFLECFTATGDHRCKLRSLKIKQRKGRKIYKREKTPRLERIHRKVRKNPYQGSDLRFKSPWDFK